MPSRMPCGNSPPPRKRIEIIGPPRHHLNAFFEEFAAQIGAANGPSSRPVRELRFNGIGVETAGLIEQGWRSIAGGRHQTLGRANVQGALESMFKCRSGGVLIYIE